MSDYLFLCRLVTELTDYQAPYFMNLESYEWSPTMISFNANADDTTRSTSWHVYDVRYFSPVPKHSNSSAF